ncbi:MAG: PspC domain-containing protein [archaeon]|mgnify:CR=1
MVSHNRLTRSTKDRILGGVCGGIAAHYGWDPTLVRLGWVLLTLFGGAGLLLYIVAWLIMPAEK